MTEYPFVNVLVVLPKRLCFNSVYFYNGFKINFRNLFFIFVLFILGIPFIYLYILLKFIHSLNLTDIVEEITPTKSIKIIMNSGKIIRNPIDNTSDLIKWSYHNMSKINIVMGLHPTPKGLHPYSHTRSGIGVMFSTKLFEPISAKIYENNLSKAYIQTFDDYSKKIPLSDIKNSAIVDLLNRRGEELAIKSIVEVYDGKHSELTANLYGTQKVMIIDENIILKNNNLINNIGGSQIVKSYVEHSEKVNNAIDNINLLIINLRTSTTKEEIYDHLNKNISDIEYIKNILSNERGVNGSNIYDLLEEINKYM